mmetsp:Transcript_12154/g.38494  ORF Transcript_12154/g.38494 Transcript_12154/m.38494 type:complete len:455 (+) Transcript_12154:67-1431(+)
MCARVTPLPPPPARSVPPSIRAHRVTGGATGGGKLRPHSAPCPSLDVVAGLDGGVRRRGPRPVQGHVEGHVHEPLVLLVPVDRNVAHESVPVARPDRRVAVEHLLPPVRGPVGVGRGGEKHGLVRRVLLRAPEPRVEVAHDALHHRPGRPPLAELALEVRGHGLVLADLLEGHGVQVVVLDHARLPQDLARMHVRPHRSVEVVLALFLVKVVCEPAHVHPVHVVRLLHELGPLLARALEAHPLLIGLPGADGCDEHLRVRGVERATRLEVHIARDKHRVQHALAQEEVAHPLRHDNVHLLGELNGLHGALEDLHDVVQLVVLDELAGKLGHVGCLDGVDLLGAGLSGPHGEDPRAGTDVEHHLVLELRRVAGDGVEVGIHTVEVAEHLLLVIEELVGHEVVGEVLLIRVLAGVGLLLRGGVVGGRHGDDGWAARRAVDQEAGAGRRSLGECGGG